MTRIRSIAVVVPARARGVADALGGSNVDPRAMWIAGTDADSTVPENWLVDQLDAADAGADVVVGTVRPDFAELDDRQIDAWRATHVPGRPNGHVHGANLGIRASAYVAVGGFSNVQEHEDVGLVQRAKEHGFALLASDAGEVVTSGRQEGRTPGGYAGYLRRELGQPDSASALPGER